MSHPAKRDRRWFRFSLRTLFVLVTVLGVSLGWVGVQLKWIHDRHEALAKRFPHYDSSKSNFAAPWSLRMFGEKGTLSMRVRIESNSELDRLRTLFPECEVSGHFRQPPVQPRQRPLTGDLTELRGMGDLDRIPDRPRRFLPDP